MGQSLWAQNGASQSRTVPTVLVLPFENVSKAPGLEWISEAFPEVLGQRLAGAHLFVISRDDRNYAFDHFGLPVNVRPSRATLYRIAEQMDADYLVVGDYSFDGQTFTGRAQVLDMKQLHLSPEMSASGPLVNLIETQSAIAWQVVKTIAPDMAGTREDFIRSAPPLRLDAFENYIRGILASKRQDKIKYFRDAIRINPQYTLATLALGKTYFAGREYEQAASWLGKVPTSDAAAGEANFLLGLSQYYLGNFDKADSAFKIVEARLPLTEVYNNLGVVASRRGRRNAVEFFQRAVLADPNDPDYHFNLAVALYKSGDSAGAARQLRDVLSRRPSDSEAKDLLATVNGTLPAPATGTAAPAPHVPLERIKRNYDENSYRQLALEIQNTVEQALSKADPQTHANFHVEHGRELFDKGLLSDAEREFREAVVRFPASFAAHAGLARIAEARNDAKTARREAETSVELKPNPDAYVVLAQLELKENRAASASELVDRALKLDPNYAAAVALKKSIASRISER